MRLQRVQQHLRSLHYLRGIAMTCVVAAHVQAMWQALSPAENPFHYAILVFLHGGAIGIFFVVAGFVFHHHHYYYHHHSSCIHNQPGSVPSPVSDIVTCTTKTNAAAAAVAAKKRDPMLLPLTKSRLLPNCRSLRILNTNSPKGEEWTQCFDFMRYMKRRFYKIGLPYVLLSTPVLLNRIYVEEERIVIKNHLAAAAAASAAEHDAPTPHDAPFGLLIWKRTLSHENLYKLVSQLCNGRDVIYAYWFIPVMLGLACLSPLAICLLQCSTTTQTFVTTASYMLALVVVGRPTGNTPAWQMILYFWPVYLTGTLLSVHRQRLLSVNESRRGECIALGILLIALLGRVVFDSQIKAQAPMMVVNGLGLLQLLLTCWWSFAAMQRYNQRCARPAVLHHVTKRLADASLDIYFLHPWILYFINGFVKDWDIEQSLARQGLIVCAVETSVVLVGCLGVSVVWRWVWKKVQSQRGRVDETNQ